MYDIFEHYIRRIVLTEASPVIYTFGQWLRDNGVKDPVKFIKDNNIYITYKREAEAEEQEITDPETIANLSANDKRKNVHFTNTEGNADYSMLYYTTKKPFEKMFQVQKHTTGKRTKDVMLGPWCRKHGLQGFIDAYEKADNELSIDKVPAYSTKEINFICTNCGKQDSRTPESIVSKRGAEELNIENLNNIKCSKCSADLVGLKNFNTYLERNGSLAEQAQNDPILQLLLDEWNYKKNKNIKNKNGDPINPQNITPNSEDEVWWKCSECFTEYQTSTSVRVRNHIIGSNTPLQTSCPKCKMKYGTSKAETVVYFYIKQLFPNAEHNYKKLEGISELDVYVPTCDLYPEGFAVEYNGEYWHKKRTDKREKDIAKQKACKNLGITLITIEAVNYDSPLMLNKPRQYYKYNANEEGAFKKILDHIFKTYFNANVDVDLKRDDLKIDKLRKSILKNRSFASVYPEKSLDWDYVNNECLLPTTYMASSSTQVHWKCHVCGYEYPKTQSISTRGQSSNLCPCLKYKNKNSLLNYKAYHDAWTEDKEEECLALQDEFFASRKIDDSAVMLFVQKLNKLRENFFRKVTKE